MSLKIKKLTGEVFDLPSDYVIEAEKNNPLFSNKGSKTVPIHFPATSNNRKLLLNSDRLDKMERPDQAIQVVAETDALQQSGLMVINSGFNAGIGFDESELYNKIGKMLLKDIPDLPVIDKGGTTLDQRLDSMLSHLTAVMKAQTETDYYVFPVLFEVEKVEGVLAPQYTLLNEVDAKYNTEDPPYGRFAELKALANRTIKKHIDGQEVILDVPKGYGVSPFLKVYRILELIFDHHFDFQIEENPFKDHLQLKKLVVLNNVMDTVLTGRLHYKDMMPDMTIKEFLDGLYNKFGMQFYLNSNSRTVKIKFLNDVLTPLKSGSINLDGKKTEEPTIAYASPKQLKLVANREIEEAGTQKDTFEEFLMTYNYQFTERYGGSSIPSKVTSAFDTDRSLYWIVDDFNAENRVYSSDFFDWDKKDDLPYEEIKMDDLCVPLELITGSGHLYLYYKIGYKHVYSDVIIGGSVMASEDNPAKLAFAFGWGVTKRTAMPHFNYFFASQINRDENGNFLNDPDGKKYDISLTCNREDGLFNRFWKQYDAFLRYSNFEVKCKMKLSDMDIFNLDMFKTAIINNQPLLPNQIKYKLNQQDAVSDCSFQTLRLYEPYSLEESQAIPGYGPQKYYWGELSNVKVPNKEAEYDSATPPVKWDVVSGHTNTAVFDNGVKIPTKRLAMMPPTEEQYKNQEKRVFVYQYVIQTLSIPFTPTVITQTLTYAPMRIEY